MGVSEVPMNQLGNRLMPKTARQHRKLIKT